MNPSIAACLSMERKINFLPAKYPKQPSGFQGTQGHSYDFNCNCDLFCINSQCGIQICKIGITAGQRGDLRSKFFFTSSSLLSSVSCFYNRAGLSGTLTSHTQRFAGARFSQQTLSTIRCFSDKPEHIHIEILSR